jgi:hypothetical protein
MLRDLLPDVLCSCWGEDEQSRLRTEPCFGESPEETAEGYEEISEEAEEGAGQDVQEQPEEYPLSEEAVLTSGAKAPSFQNLYGSAGA